MTATAIVLMLVAMLIVWGGLALAAINLTRSVPQADPPTSDDFRRDL